MTHDHRFRFEEVAKLDSEERKARQPAAPLVALVTVGEPSTVLEIGVGTGYFALPIAQALPTGTVVGLDVEPRMLEVFESRAREQGLSERVRSVEGTVDRAGGIPLEDDSVDAALMANLYHELDDRAAALREVRRVLAVGASLVVCDWLPEGTTDFGPPQDHRVGPESVERDLRAAGFSSVERREIYEHFYTLVTR